MTLVRSASVCALLLTFVAPPAWSQTAVVDTFAGVSGVPGSSDGAADQARFARPEGLAITASGVIYVADTHNHAIRRVGPDGTTTTLAGYPGVAGHLDGTGTGARFNTPIALAIGPDGVIYVSDAGSHIVRRVTHDGVVTTLAGYPTLPGWADGQGLGARFNSPGGIAVDARGLVFVVDRGNRTLRTVTPDGVVSTFVGAVGQAGIVDGPASTARLSHPGDLAIDDLGNLYFAELWGHVVRRVTPWGHVTTLAGSLYKSGTADGPGPQARFYFPLGVAVDRAGGVYVADTDNDTIRHVTPAGVVTTIAGQPRVRGTADGPASTATFRNPSDVVVDAGGTVFVADTGNSSIRRVAGRAPLQFTRYLAEGASTSFFSTTIALLNPEPVDTVATLTFQNGDGSSVPYVVPVPGLTRATVSAADVPGLGEAEFSVVVTSGEPLVVDRTMRWGADGYGAHGETAIIAPSATWHLAEGATHSGLQLFYLLQNSSDAPATVRVRYLRVDGPPLQKVYTLQPRSRTNIWVNVEEFEGLGTALVSTEVSAEIQSLDGQPIIVERAMYRSTPTALFLAGHESAGITTPAPRWFLAEGATGAWFDTFVLIANPTADEATARLTYLLADGQTYSRNLLVAPTSRASIWVDQEQFEGVVGTPLADVAVSTTVESLNGVPLIVERAMWWPGDASSWHESHAAGGASATGTRWAVADGEVGGLDGVETYLLIANTSSTAGSATVTLHFEGGGSTVLSYALAPHSRTNVAIGPDFGAVVNGRRFGAIVESTGAHPVQIVVERATYADAGTLRWAAGANALATRLR